MAAILAFLSTVGFWSDILAKPQLTYDGGFVRGKLLESFCETKVRVRKYALVSSYIKAYITH